MAAQAEKASKAQEQTVVERFHAEYSAALHDAQVSADHTSTEGWQKLYSDHKRAVRTRRRDLGKSLVSYGKKVEDFGLTEEDEKAIKDIAKSSAEIRGLEEIFRAEALDRVCAPIVACDNLITNFRAEASRQEKQAPLHNTGLEDRMRKAIAGVARPVFNSETGEVEIRKPS